jgi:hypothetical protein
VGDRPAPDRPDDPEYHFTPFSALWNSSLYINLALHNAGIPEEALAWVNAVDWQGKAVSYDVLDHDWELVICLGGKAEAWLKKSPRPLSPAIKVHHPAAWKRFHSKETYPLGEILRSHLALSAHR